MLIYLIQMKQIFAMIYVIKSKFIIDSIITYPFKYHVFYYLFSGMIIKIYLSPLVKKSISLSLILDI